MPLFRSNKNCTLNTNHLNSLEEYNTRKRRRKFADGPIAGLCIQEYWQPDIPPSGSEQEITFYVADAGAFKNATEFGTYVCLFEMEDGITETARASFALEHIAPISIDDFEQLWTGCVAKLESPPLVSFHDSLTAYAISDDWNQKCYLAHDSEKYYAVCWSTTA